MTFVYLKSIFKCRIIFHGKFSRIEEIGAVKLHAVKLQSGAVKLRPLSNKF